MSLKILLAGWIASRIETRTRRQRRALRDYQRQETTRIRTLETRSRGLRLYAAWARSKNSNVIPTHAADWHEAAFPQAA